MSSQFELFVVDERKLPVDAAGTDQERYERLVHAVRQRGAAWRTFSLDLRTFALGLKAIDAHIGGRKFLPIFAFNNSPANVLGNDGDCPDFGYFTPEAARDLAVLLGRIPQQTIEDLAKDAATGSLYWGFRDAAEEATRRGYAVAVLHDAPSVEALVQGPHYSADQFVAHSVSEGMNTSYTVEERASKREAIRVDAVQLEGDTLRITYTQRLSSMPLATARDVLDRVLLLDFLQDKFAGRAAKVAYLNAGLGTTQVRPYPRRNG